MKQVFSILLFFIASQYYVLADETLTLQQCFDLALERNLSLKPFEHQIRAQDGFIEQAGLHPNPELTIETENVLGTGNFQTIDGAEITLGISQTLETARKREKRINLANREKSLSKEEYQRTRLDVLYRTANAFIDLLAAQEMRTVQQQFQQISQEIYQTIRARVEAGRDSPMEEIRARIMTANTQIDLDRIERQCTKLRIELAGQWSSLESSFLAVEGDLLAIPSTTELEHSIDSIFSHPEMALIDGEISKQEDALMLETALASPDITIQAGVRYLAESDDATFIVGFSIPLPIHNRNQGAIRAAGELVHKAESMRVAKENELNASLRSEYQTLLQAIEEAARLREEIIPSTQQAFDISQEGYRQGKFPYLSVLDTQRSLFESKVQYIDAMTSVHKANNKINLLSANYDALTNNPEESKP